MNMHDRRSSGSNANFSDLIVSGHVGITFIIMCSILSYGDCWQKIISTWIAVGQAYVNLAVGDHYTSDVVLAVVMAVLLHTNSLLN